AAARRVAQPAHGCRSAGSRIRDARHASAVLSPCVTQRDGGRSAGGYVVGPAARRVFARMAPGAAHGRQVRSPAGSHGSGLLARGRRRHAQRVRTSPLPGWPLPYRRRRMILTFTVSITKTNGRSLCGFITLLLLSAG